jgi:hypothetical protein
MPEFEEIISEAIRMGNQYVTPARVTEMLKELDIRISVKSVKSQ